MLFRSELIGDLTPSPGFYEGRVRVRCTYPRFTDMQLNKDVLLGEEYEVSRQRADELIYLYNFEEV